jgi:hypothetical protein
MSFVLNSLDLVAPLGRVELIQRLVNVNSMRHIRPPLSISSAPVILFIGMVESEHAHILLLLHKDLKLVALELLDPLRLLWDVDHHSLN